MPCAHCSHTIHQHQSHFGWSNAFAPVVRVAPGSSIEFDVQEASGGQFTPRSNAADVAAMDFGKLNPVTGPIFIDGAEPGDVLKVSILEFAPSGWGWTANIPGFGLLADDFTEPALHVWDYRPDLSKPAMFGAFARIPLKPFTGTLGVAPAAPGVHSIVPPRRVGGNLDIRDLSAGTEVYLPVEVAGALFSVGDTHAAQGDGEVCGTAIESPMRVALKFDLVKRTPLAYPRFTMPGSASAHHDARGYEVTTGIAPDLMEASRAAVRGMIELLATRHAMRPMDAYMLCSVAGDLRISQIVDRPNWTVSFYLPRQIFE